MPAEDVEKPAGVVTLSSAVVRCICVLSSFVVLACALLGLGVACICIEKFSSDAGPCPGDLQLIAFSAAGGFLFLSVVLYFIVGRKKKRLRLRHDEEKLLTNSTAPPPTPDGGAGDSPDQDLQEENDVRANCKQQDLQLNHCEETENFAMTQKSADVSYWIEQQKPMSEECFPLDTPDGATMHDSDTESSEAEVTAL